jgi:Oxidoreductase family, NAD-binding Rossmann fold/Oxidoreductase family, C-terminal alpha/beta domain
VNSPPRRADPQQARGIGTPSSQSAVSKLQDVSVLLVGAGRRGLTALVPALGASKPMQLAAIVETPQRIAELQTMPELALPLYDSIDSALATCTPHLAIVATPHDSHVPLAIRLLEAHIPTLLEKPPARNCREFSGLIQASDDNQTPLTTVLTLHYQSRFKDFIRTLRSPALTDAKVFITADVPSWPGIGHWRQSRVRAGGGVLMDLGYHYLELLVTCLGLPDRVAVKLRAQAATDGVEDQAHASLYFAARRIAIDIRLRSGTDLARRSELLILRDREPIFASASSPPCAQSQRSAGAPVPSAAIAQLTSLLGTGFLTGGGPWRKTLARQVKVLSLLDQMYAGAEYIAQVSERVLV